MGFLGALASGLFTLLLSICTIPGWIIASIGMKCCGQADTLYEVEDHTIISSSFKRKVLYITRCGWKLALCLCCWIRVETYNWEELAEMGSSGRPCVLLANHLSFLDTILVVILVPWIQAAKTRALVMEATYKIPLVGKILQGSKQLPVPFKSAGEGMEVDRDKMAITLERLEKHVSAGGTGAWFPEGRLNKEDPATVQLFRAGAFVLPVKLDVEIWLISFCGNAVCWPRTSTFGGRPAKIGVHATRLCISSHQLLAEHFSSQDSDERARSVFLASRAQQEVQKCVDTMITKGCSVGAKKIPPPHEVWVDPKDDKSSSCSNKAPSCKEN